MTSQANKDNSETAEVNPPRPGQRLHAARAAAELDLAKLAAQMHLSEETLRAVEADDYDLLPNRVFVRGYYRNYARLLGLPEAEILSELDSAWPEEGVELTIKPVGSEIKQEVRSSHSLVRLVTWLIVLGSVALFVVWWVGYLQWQEQPSGTEVAPSQEAAPAADNLLSLPLPEPAAVPEPEPPVDGQAVDEPAAVPGEAVVPLPPTDEAGPAPETTLDLPAEEPPVAEPIEPAAEPQSAAAPRILVSFNDDCWTDIRDRSGSFRLYGLMRSGTARELDGEPPYQMLFGNSAAVTLSIDGRPYDHSRHSKANVARFTLGADELSAE